MRAAPIHGGASAMLVFVFSSCMFRVALHGFAIWLRLTIGSKRRRAQVLTYEQHVCWPTARGSSAVYPCTELNLYTADGAPSLARTGSAPHQPPPKQLCTVNVGSNSRTPIATLRALPRALCKWLRFVARMTLFSERDRRMRARKVGVLTCVPPTVTLT
jgi:hypothetical protein